MPVRKVSNRGRRNVIGKFPSIKMGRMVMFESTVELDYIHHLEWDKNVFWFEEQPLTIEYEYNGKICRYTPDFHINRSNQSWLVEVKPNKFLHTEENHRKFGAAARHCGERDMIFYVATSSEIRSGYRLANIKFLIVHARRSISADTRARIYAELLEAQRWLTVLELAKRANPNDPQAALLAVYHMCFHHELEIPIDDAPISANSPVSYPTQKGSN